MQHQKEGVNFLYNSKDVKSIQKSWRDADHPPVSSVHDIKGGGLFFQMRLGKTRTLLEALTKFKTTEQILPILIIAPLSVVPVWPAESAKFNYNFKFTMLTGTRQQRLAKLAEPADVYVINYEGARLLSKQLLEKGFKSIVLDECFIGSTLVKTPYGSKPISEIKVGDVVCSAIGQGIIKSGFVRSVFVKKTNNLIKLTTENEIIYCTPEHPFFTNDGWIKACNLNQSHCIKTHEQTMRMVSANNNKQMQGEQILRKILLSEMEDESTRICPKPIDSRKISKTVSINQSSLYQRPKLCIAKFKTNDKKQSNENGWSQREGLGHIAKDGAQTNLTRRQWNWPNQGRTSFVKGIARMGLELCNISWEKAKRLSNLLQGRFSLPFIKNSSGNRWVQPQSVDKASSRQEKRSEIEGIRVVSVESIKRESFEQHGFSSSGVDVYNLEVSGHPSYIIGKDELVVHNCHRIKSLKSQQTRVILELGYQAKYRFILTGTPITKSPEDMWSQIQFLSPGYLGNFYSFRARYVEFRKVTVPAKGGMREIQIPYRFKHLAELEERISKLCLRKTQAECFDLPEMSYKTIYCHMEADQMKAYYEMKHCLQIEVNEQRMTVKSALTQIGKLQQLCHGFIYDSEGKPQWLKTNCKIEVLKDLLQDIVSEKIVLFCNFKADLELIGKTLADEGHKYILYNGTAEERHEAIKQFDESVEPVIFLTTIELGKEGINLSAACHVIFYGRNYNYASRYQAEARIQSAFQKRNLIYYDLIVPNTIDEKVLQILQMKGDVADKILGDSVRLAMMEVSNNQLNIEDIYG